MRILSSTLALLALAAPALAAEEEAAASPFAGDLGNMVWTVVIFLLVVVVLGKFAWTPLLNALQGREAFIHKALADAQQDRDAAEARLKEYTEKLLAARSEASAIVDEGRRDAEAVKRKVLEEAQQESRLLTERAKREIALATETALETIYQRAAVLATDAASRIVGRELDPKDHERLIRESIAALDKEARN